MLRKLLIIAGFWLLTAQQADPSSEQMLRQAEALYAEKSFAKAHQIYSQVPLDALSDEEADWVEFRRADTLWRSGSGQGTDDNSQLQLARRELQQLIEREDRQPGRPGRIWAEAHLSLGDLQLDQSRYGSNWNEAWKHYRPALDWWAGSPDVETARRRYLDIVLNAFSNRDARPNSFYPNYSAQNSPHAIAVLEKAHSIAAEPEDRAATAYLLASFLIHRGNVFDSKRAAGYFEQLIEEAGDLAWGDRALFEYAQRLENNGLLEYDDQGNMRRQPDPAKALQLYRRLVQGRPEGESAFYRRAKERIKDITSNTLEISINGAYFPGSEIQFRLRWRNLSSLQLELFAVDLTRNVSPDLSGRSHDWNAWIDPNGRKPLYGWTQQLPEIPAYHVGQQDFTLEQRLEPGAYLLRGRSADAQDQAILLVSQAALVLLSGSGQVTAYFCHAWDGSPLKGAQVSLWELRRDNDDWRWIRHEATADRQGLARFESLKHHSGSLHAFARKGNQQAYAQTYQGGRPGHPLWTFHSITDRPAYRPGELAQWKVAARIDGPDGYQTPAGRELLMSIQDPQGREVSRKTLTLNEFGSAWGSMELSSKMPLGMYSATFSEPGGNRNLHRTPLFRLEEYKLPEFRVEVEIPQHDSQPKVFRPGERIEALIRAEYYFGGPVAGAEVEVIVQQKPFHPSWRPPRRYPWLYRDYPYGIRYYNLNQPATEVHRESLLTDASGQVRFSYQPQGAAEDREYIVQARVHDASRREVTASASLKATRQRVFLFPQTRKSVYRPGDVARIEVWAKDANQQPVQAAGTWTVSRERTVEVWYDPQGRVYKGDDLERIRRRLPQMPGLQGWIRHWMVEREEVLSKPFQSQEEGKIESSFRPVEEGRYRMKWFSPDPDAMPAKAETAIWVASNSTSDLGIRSGGVEMVLENDTVRPGGKARLLLTLAEPEGYVLLSRQSGFSDPEPQLIRVEGTAKLVELEITERDMPRLSLTAALVNQGSLHQDSKEIVVPPEEKFLRLEAATDRDEYRPRQEGTISLRVLDQQGNPVRAEVAVSVADESVFAIQQSLTSDPRQVFYGRRTSDPLRVSSSFQFLPYRRMVKNESLELFDQYSIRPQNGRRRGGFISGVPGGVPAGAIDGAYEKSADFSYSRVEVRSEFGAVQRQLALARPDAPAPPPAVRSDFRSTLLWQPGLVSDEQGRISVPVEFADKLTAWKAAVQALTVDSRVGNAEVSMRTSQPLIVRLQAPRFFLQGDLATVSLVIHNNSKSPETVRPSLKWTGVRFEELSAPSDEIEVVPDGEARVDWRLRVLEAGRVRFRAEARGGRLGDAVEQAYPVFEHGLERLIAHSGKVDADEELIALELPSQRRPESTRLQITVTPSLAAAMLDALPYLIDYPYGCTEQTMSRFLPAVVVANTLRDQGVSPQILERRLYGNLDPRIINYRGTGIARLDDVVGQGLQRLYSFQHSDGGWGWWKEGQSDLYMSAYVLWGLSLSRQAGIGVDSDVWFRAFRFLEENLAEAGQDPDLQAWMLQALTSVRSAKSDPVSTLQRAAVQNLWQHRQDLSAAGRALLALSVHRLGEASRVSTLLRNLENGARRDNPSTSSLAPQSQGKGTETVHWGNARSYRRWWEGAVESTALHLQALIEIDPSHPLIQPAVQWLVQNRRGNQWSNTRDTALSVLALDEYLKATGELKANAGFEVLVNGEKIASGELQSLEEALASPVRIEVGSRRLRDGLNRIQIRRTSDQGSLYYAAETRFFSLEEPIPAGGHQIFVEREYFRLLPVKTLLKGTAFERRPLQTGQALQSGERVEVILTIEAKNDLRYLMLEDLKPAGLESVEVQSGSGPPARRLSREEFEERQASGQLKPPDPLATGRSVYRELRDRKVALFIDRLEQGLWEIRYQLRAEVPGTFHALPLTAEAMYAPEIRANSQEHLLEIVDR